MKKTCTQTLLGLLRIAMGWTFLWAFVDKLWGLGFATTAENAWLSGGSPTSGFLTYATKGPFAETFQSLAGQAWVDWLFMAGLLLIGVALLLGIAMRLACYGGAILFLLMYVAGFMPPEHNPFLDDHIIYAVLLMYLLYAESGKPLGLAKKWKKTSIAKQHPWLQ